MEKIKLLFFAFLLINLGRVESAGLLERSYEYVINMGKSFAPNVLAIIDCFAEEDPWLCSKQKTAKMLQSWEKENDVQRRSWKEAADAEVISSGRSTSELPSAIATEVESSLQTLSDMIQIGIAKATARTSESGIDPTQSASQEKKKHKKVPLIAAPAVFQQEKTQAKGRSFSQSGKAHVQSWVIGSAVKDDVTESTKDVDRGVRKGRGLLEEAWSIGEKAIDAVAEHVAASENAENGLKSDKGSIQEQRGKKKKKKAILKLLILGAVLKAKIATLLQILSFKLQVKFFIIALIGLGINLARFWLDLKKTHQHPQKVIYYEHASHQHHYDHEDEHGWGPWSRSIDPEEEVEGESSSQNTPYRIYDRNTQIFTRPAP